MAPEDVITPNDGEYASLVREEAQVHRQIPVTFRALLPVVITDDTEVTHVLPFFKHAYPSFVALLWVAPQTVDAAWIEAAGNVEKPLRLQPLIERAEVRHEQLFRSLFRSHPNTCVGACQIT